MSLEQQDTLRRLYNFARRESDKNRAVEYPPSISKAEESVRVMQAVSHGKKFLDFLQEVSLGSVEGIDANLDRFERMVGLLIHPEAAMLGQYAYDSIGDERFAFVALGSGALGGMWTRDLSGSLHNGHPYSYRQDLDLALLYDGPELTRIESAHLQARVSRLLRYPDDPELPRGFRGCDGMGVRAMQFPKINSDNVRQIVLEDPMKLGQSLVYYFYPSFPAEVNMEARRLILAELEQARRENPVDWSIYASEISKVLVKQGVEGLLREKHFQKKGILPRTYSGEDARLLQEARGHLKTAFGTVILDLVRSVDPNFTYGNLFPT